MKHSYISRARRLRPVLGALVVVAAFSSPAAHAQDTALLIGNTNYNTLPDLPGVITDLLLKHNALDNAGWTVVNMTDLTAAQMETAITANIPPTGKRYFVWYAGHGDVTAQGDLVGVAGSVVTPAAFVAALGAAANRTTVKLDSCGSGAFATAANTAAGANAGGLAFITAVTGLDCTSDVATFTQCFTAGLNGAADGAGGGTVDGMVTVAEAGAYAIANCNAGSTPTYDGDNPGWVIGSLKQNAGCCVLPGVGSVHNISEAVCLDKGGKWNATVCVPATSSWGLGVLVLLVVIAATVTLRRRAAVV